MGKAKNKTHKATAKRFKVSAKGKMKHYRQGDNAHMKVNKSKSQLRRQEGLSIISSKAETRKLKSLILQ